MAATRSLADDVTERALKIYWNAGTRPTEDELFSAFHPFGAIARVGIKERCAAVLFASAESVATAIDAAATSECIWDKAGWDVRPMADAMSGESISMIDVAGVPKGSDADPSAPSIEAALIDASTRIDMHTLRNAVAVDRRHTARYEHQWKEAQSEAPLEQNATEHEHVEVQEDADAKSVTELTTSPLSCLEISQHAEVGADASITTNVKYPPALGPPRSKIGTDTASEGGRATGDLLMPELGPSSVSEGFEVSCSYELGGDTWHDATLASLDAIKPSRASSRSNAVKGKCMGERSTEEAPGEREAHEGLNDEKAGSHLIPVDVTSRTDDTNAANTTILTQQYQLPQRRRCSGSKGLTAPSALSGLAPSSAVKPKEGAYSFITDIDERDEAVISPSSVLSHDQNTDLQRNGVPVVEKEVQQIKARDQLKRLALETARLRAALRGTRTDLEAERAKRKRSENEWWRKSVHWDEERTSLITARHEAELASRVAKEEVERKREQAASDTFDREEARRKEASAMKAVVDAQERLVKALHTELEITNRAREATQDEAIEAKKQLHLYVADFLLWRDRAKQLEIHIMEVGVPKSPPDDEKGGARPTSPLVGCAPRHDETACDGKLADSDARNLANAPREPERAFATCADQLDGGNRAESTSGMDDRKGNIPRHEYCDSNREDPGRNIRSWQGQGRRHDGVDDCENLLSVPEAFARYLETNGSISTALRVKNQREDARAREASTAAFTAVKAAARLGATGNGGTMSSTSQTHFQRSMKAQQDLFVRLERDLARARADLRNLQSADGRDETPERLFSPEAEDTGTAGWTNSVNDADGGTIAARPRTRHAEAGVGKREILHEQDHQLRRLTPDVGSVDSRTAGDINATDGYSLNVTGPHMARVLAALLGTSASDAENTTTQMSDFDKSRSTPVSTPLTRRLSDYPPELQAVFGGQPLPPCALPSRQRQTSRNRRSLHPKHKQGGQLEGGQESLRHDLPKPVRQDSAVARAQEAVNDELGNSEGMQCQALALDDNAEPMLSLVHPANNPDDPIKSAAKADPILGAVSTLPRCESSALTGAFSKYQPKSPLLQRWLEERVIVSRPLV